MTLKSYKKKDGKTYWEAYGYLGIDPKTGKPKRKRMSGFKTKRAAEKAFANAVIESKDQRLKYKDIYELWLDLYKKQVKESTLRQTLTIFRLHILPAFGEFYIDSITLSDIQPVVTEWCEKYVKAPTIKAYLSLVFDEAMRIEAIDKNPCDLLKLFPKEKDTKVKKQFLERDELTEVLSLLEDYDIQWYTFFRLLAYTGLRRGEALALTWDDLIGNTLYVNKALIRGVDETLVKDPKTKSSIRDIDLDSTTLEALNTWRIEQIRIIGIQPLMFCNINKEYFSFSKPSHVLNKIFKKTSIEPISTHGFRHTHVAILSELGVDLGAIQKRLGHGDIKTTMNIYHHVTKRTKEELIEKLSNY